MKKLTTKLTTLLIALTMSTSLLATTFVVTDNSNSGAGTLRQALADAVDGDEIIFNLASGDETISLSSQIAKTGVDFTLDGSNHAGSGTQVTIQVTTPGTSNWRIFDFNPYSGGVITIKNVNLKGGDVAETDDGVGGGCIFFHSSGILNIENVNITGSKANEGGAIYASGTLNILNSTISGCSVVNYVDFDGMFYSYIPGSGGAIYGVRATINISHSTISGNTAIGIGGGIMLYGITATSTITNSIFTGNSATIDNSHPSDVPGNGGAIYIGSNQTLILTNTTIFNNVADSEGGGLYPYYSSSTTINSSTITNNHSNNNNSGDDYGGGIYLFNGTLAVQNTIIANNFRGSGTTTGDDYYYANGTLTDNGYNVVENQAGASNQFGATNNLLNTDPTGLASSLTYEGGFTDVLKVTAGNISSGNTGSTTETTDQRGYYRTSSTITRGAYQYNGVFARKASQSDWSSSSNTYSNWSSAISACSTGDNAMILAPTAILGAGVTIAKTITIQGDGAASTFVQADDTPNTASDRVYNITAGTVTLEDMTIRHGKTPDAAWASNAEHGGGIFNTGTLTLEDCTVSYNYTGEGGNNSGSFSTAGEGGRGAGLYSTGSLTISGSTFSHNTSGKGGDSGGGIPSMSGKGGDGAGIYTNVTSASISNSTFSDNTTGSSGSGGSTPNVGGTGACIHHAAGTMTIDECTLSENTSSYCGGGIENWATLSITNSTISGNTGINIGGGISSRSGTLTITNCTMSGNTLTSGSYGGGGMGLYATSATVSSCTFANNSTTGISNNGGGILLYSGTLEIKNTIIANNSSVGTADFHKSGGTLTNNGYNAVETQNGTDFVNGSNGCITGTTCGENLSTTLADNGGATMTLAIESSSVAISAGSWNASITTDQRGESRHEFNPTIGAYEPRYSGYWTGTTNHDWNTTTNWDDGGVAESGDDVIIPNVTNDPEIGATGTATCNGLTIKSGATLTIKSTSEGTGSIIVNGTLSNSGTITSQRYFPGSTLFNWHMVSSPMDGMDISESNFIVDPATNYDFYAWYEPTPGTWVNYKATGDLTFAQSTVNNGDNFVNGKGYLVAYNEANPTKTFTGNLNTGDKTFTLKCSGGKSWTWYAGWNLLGNPYSSAIDWNDAPSRTDKFEDNYAYIYDPNKSGGEGYVTVDGGSADAYIASNQGFFVRARLAANNTSFTFNNAMQTHGGSYMKNQTNVERLVLRFSDGEHYDETEIKLNNQSSHNNDRNDAIKLYSFSSEIPQLLSYSLDEVPLAVNSIPEVTPEKNIKIGLRVPKDGLYTLSVIEASIYMMDHHVYLEDLLLNTIHKISESDYSFTIDAGDIADRFIIHFGMVGIEDQPQNQSNIQTWAANNTIHILNPENSRGEIRILNLFGQQVAQAKLTGDTKQQIQLNAPTGCYLVSVISDEGVVTRKVMVN